MSERLDSLLHMGLPAAVLQALVPRSPALAPEPQRRPVNAAASDVDRYTGDSDGSAPERGDQVVAELRGLAALHQARQAARATADTAEPQAA